MLFVTPDPLRYSGNASYLAVLHGFYNPVHVSEHSLHSFGFGNLTISLAVDTVNLSPDCARYRVLDLQILKQRRTSKRLNSVKLKSCLKRCLLRLQSGFAVSLLCIRYMDKT